MQAWFPTGNLSMDVGPARQPRSPLAFPSGGWATFPTLGAVPHSSICTVSRHLQRQFYFFLSIWMPFISSYLIAVARTSSTMLTKRRPCLVPNLKENTFSFCPLSMMLAAGLSYMPFYMLTYVPSLTTFLRVFIMNGCWILSNVFLQLLIWL